MNHSLAQTIYAFHEESPADRLPARAAGPILANMDSVLSMEGAARGIAPLPGSAQGRTRWIAALMIFLLCIGAAIRVRQYAARTSFWGDEAFVVMNLRELSPLQLMGKLKWDQAAPPFFLWSLQAMSHLGGENEYSLRLIPLLCGLGGLGIFATLAWRLLPPPAALLAFGLFALDRRLVEFAADVKQYSGDVMISALLLFVALGRRDTPPLRRLSRTAILAAVAIWFSHSTAMVFGGISIALAISCLRRDRRDALKVVGCNALFAGSFLILYFVSIHPQHTDFLQQYWKAAFPDSRYPLLFPRWLWRQGFEFLQTPYRWPGILFTLLIILSLLSAWQRRSWEIWIAIAAPLCLTVAAATLHQYPFNGMRLTLFLMPELYLLVGIGAAAVFAALPPLWKPVWWALPIALVGTGLAVHINRFVHPPYLSHIRPAVEFAEGQSRPGDALVLLGEPDPVDRRGAFSGRHLEALCYWLHPPGKVYTTVDTFNDVREERFWLLVAFTPGNSRRLKPLLEQARSVAAEKMHFVDEHGGAAYLFERPNHP